MIEAAAAAARSMGRPHISVTINEVKANALVDSGADICLVRASLLNQMPRPPCRLQENKVCLDVANRPLDSCGVFSLPITLPNGRTVQFPALAVNDLGSEVVLGVDFQRATGAVIAQSPNGTEVTFDRPASAAAMKSYQDQVPSTFLLETVEDRWLPAGLTRPLTLQVATAQGTVLRPGATVLVEPSPEFDIFTPEALVKVQDNNRIRIQVRNCRPQDLKLTKGSCLPGVTVTLAEDFTKFPATAAAVRGLAAEGRQPPKEGARLSEEDKKYLLQHLDLSGVPAEVKKDYVQFVLRNHDVFSKGPMDVGHATVLRHSVKLINDKPCHVPQFRIPMAHEKAIDEFVEEMTKAKVIYPGHSPHNSPIFCVTKPSGGLRVVQDLRAINANSLDDKYSIRSVSECLNAVGRSKPSVFSTLDLSHGFWQLDLEEASRPTTAFTVPHRNRQYIFRRAPMGLKGAPASFSRLMGVVFEGLPNVTTYVDDAMVASASHEEHLQLLERVAARLRDHNLKLNVKKCFLGRREVSYLGFHLSARGVSPQKDKVRAISELKPPTSVTQIQEYLGLFNYFRHLIQNFAFLAGPLNHLTSKASGYEGGPLPPAALEAFEALKMALCSEPIVGFVDPDLPYRLACDAAHGTPERPGGVGAILSQMVDGKEKVIAYFSRALRDHEKNYDPFNLEQLALVASLDYFHEFVVGAKVEALVDHLPLQPHATRAAKTLSNLQRKLNEYPMVTVKYRPGSQNGGPDALSRNPVAASVTVSLDKESMREAQVVDPWIAAVRSFLTTRALPEEKELRDAVTSISAFCYVQDEMVWMVKPRSGRMPKTTLLAPASKRRAIMANAHGPPLSGHWKVERTVERVLNDFFWPTIAKDVQAYIDACSMCQINDDRSASKTRVDLNPWPQARAFNDRVHIDLVGPLRSSGHNKHICVMTDAFSKWVELRAIPDKKASTVAKVIFEQYICRYGCMRLLVCDNGKEFANQVLLQLLSLLKVGRHLVSPHHPQAQGQVERFNRSMKSYLLSYVADDTLNWEEFLPPLQLAHNTAVNASTKHSPFFLVFNQDPVLPWSIAKPRPSNSSSMPAEKFNLLLHARDLVISNNDEARRSYEEYYNRKAAIRKFKPGDRCLVYFKDQKPGMNSKLYCPWKGMYRVTAVLDHGVLALVKLPEMTPLRVHMQRVKLFHDFDSPEAADVDLGGDGSQGPRHHTSTENRGQLMKHPSSSQERLLVDQRIPRPIPTPDRSDNGQQAQQSRLDTSLAFVLSQAEASSQPAASTPQGSALPIASTPQRSTSRVPQAPHPQLSPIAGARPPASVTAPAQPSLGLRNGPPSSTLQRMATDLFPSVATRRVTRQAGVPVGHWVDTPQGLQFQKPS